MVREPVAQLGVVGLVVLCYLLPHLLEIPEAQLFQPHLYPPKALPLEQDRRRVLEGPGELPDDLHRGVDILACVLGPGDRSGFQLRRLVELVLGDPCILPQLLEPEPVQPLRLRDGRRSRRLGEGRHVRDAHAKHLDEPLHKELQYVHPALLLQLSYPVLTLADRLGELLRGEAGLFPQLPQTGTFQEVKMHVSIPPRPCPRGPAYSCRPASVGPGSSLTPPGRRRVAPR